MQTMSQNQQRYAMKRVEEIRKVKEEQLREQHTTVSKKLTDAQKLKEIRRGNVDVDYRRLRCINENTPILSIFDFGYIEDSDVLDQTAFDKDKQKLRKEIAKVTDEIMLGDATKAKQLLDKLEQSV